MRYVVKSARVVVTARATPDLVARWSKGAGTIELDPDHPAGARAEITVDIRTFDAGDWFSHWRVNAGLDVDRHPTARFLLMRLEGARESTPGQIEGVAVGQLQWRGHTTDVRARGKARISRRQIDATGSFDVDARRLGVAAGDLLAVEVTLSAAPG